MKVHLISDLHLLHRNILRTGRIGLRPFDTLDDMHARIVEGWNSVVKDNDTVYMLGDLTLERIMRNSVDHFWDALFALCQQLRGRKRIILGNHDHLTPVMYQLLGFEKILAEKKLGGCLLTHRPVHPSQFSEFVGNIHGHTHDKHVRIAALDVPDRRYLNVSVEALNYVPITIDEAVAVLERGRG